MAARRWRKSAVDSRQWIASYFAESIHENACCRSED
jgi:hypothetical protein